MAHRDNLGLSPGATTTPPGPARSSSWRGPRQRLALAPDRLRLHRRRRARRPRRRRVRREPDRLRGRGSPRSSTSTRSAATARRGSSSRATRPASPSPTLLATGLGASRRRRGRRGEPGALAQLVDLAFPFSLYEQAPFVSHGVPGGDAHDRRQPPAAARRRHRSRLDEDRVGELGRAAQMLLGSLDESAEVRAGRSPTSTSARRSCTGGRSSSSCRALVPVLAATVDLFARCRRRTSPCSRRFEASSRLGVWLWIGRLRALRRRRHLPERRGPADRPGHADRRRLAGARAASRSSWASRASAGSSCGAPDADPRTRRREELGGHLASPPRPGRRRPRRRGREPVLAPLPAPVAPRLALAAAAP